MVVFVGEERTVSSWLEGDHSGPHQLIILFPLTDKGTPGKEW